MDYATVIGSIAALIVIIGSIWAIFKWPFQKTPKTDLSDDTIERIAAPASNDGPALTVPEFIRIRRELKADLEAELAEASQGEKQQLIARIAELESQIADPEPALAEARKRIAHLEVLLERSGNEIGGDRLSEARAALEKGDYSIADDLFAEIEARRAMEVQEAARAAFGRGEIAEAEVRWADAAAHYARAARLAPDLNSLRKASEFTRRAGEYEAAIMFSGQMVKAARADESPAALAGALNEHAINTGRLGRYAEAEGLFREALEIDRATIGEGHPDYATRLSNLAGAVRAQGGFEEAEGLYREALEIDRATIGEGHPDYATRLSNLAGVVQAQGRYEEAERYSREALEIAGRSLGPEHPSTITFRENLEAILASRAGPPGPAG